MIFAKKLQLNGIKQYRIFLLFFTADGLIILVLYKSTIEIIQHVLSNHQKMFDKYFFHTWLGSLHRLRLSKVYRPTRHSLRHFGENVFTGQMTQPTVSKHWRRVVSYPESSKSHQAYLTMLHNICYEMTEIPNGTWLQNTVGASTFWLNFCWANSLSKSSV